MKKIELRRGLVPEQHSWDEETDRNYPFWE